MKYAFLLLFCSIFVATVHSQDDHLVNPASSKIALGKLTATDWQADLRFLQQTVDKEYAFLFKKVTAETFDTEVEKLYKGIPAMKDHERMAGLARIISLFKYGHTSIGWRESPVQYHIAPVNFYWFSDGLYVEGADKKYTSIVGAKLGKSGRNPGAAGT